MNAIEKWAMRVLLISLLAGYRSRPGKGLQKNGFAVSISLGSNAERR